MDSLSTTAIGCFLWEYMIKWPPLLIKITLSKPLYQTVLYQIPDWPLDVLHGKVTFLPSLVVISDSALVASVIEISKKKLLRLHDVAARKRSRILVNATYSIKKDKWLLPGSYNRLWSFDNRREIRFERDWYPQRKTLLGFGEKMVVNRVSYLCLVIWRTCW